MELNIRKIMMMTALVCMLGNQVQATAQILEFKGVSLENAGKNVTVGVYDKDPTDSGFTLENVKYINQSTVAADGSFRILIPVNDGLTDFVVRSNLTGDEVAEAEPIYCSNNGTESGDGTEESPYSFQSAIEHAENNDTIMLLDEVVLPESFVWPDSEKNLYIKGDGENGKLNLTTLKTLYVGCNASFDNMELIVGDGRDAVEDGISNGAADKTGYNYIFAKGNHLVIGPNVTTSNLVRALYGGCDKNTSTTVVDGCNVELYGGNYKNIFGGSRGLAVNGDVSVTLGGTANINTTLDQNKTTGDGARLYGGCDGANVSGTSHISIKDSAKLNYLFGGGTGELSGMVGKIRISIEGGEIMNVFAVSGRNQSPESYICDSEIVMTDGVVEAVFAGAENKDVYGKITAYLLGGAVTRRAYAGCYNDYNLFSWASDYFVTGTSTLVIGPGLNSQAFTDSGLGDGIFGGSRRKSNDADEIGRLVFLDDCYDRFKSHIGNGSIFKSHHDYILSEGKNGSAVFADLTENPPTDVDSALVRISPDTWYYSLVNDVEYEEEYYSVTGTDLVTVSFSAKDAAIISAESAPVANGVNINYFTDTSSTLIVAVYKDNRFVTMSIAESQADESAQEVLIPVDCELNTSYKVVVMMWDGLDRIVPICDPFVVSLSAQ